MLLVLLLLLLLFFVFFLWNEMKREKENHLLNVMQLKTINMIVDLLVMTVVFVVVVGG